MARRAKSKKEQARGSSSQARTVKSGIPALSESYHLQKYAEIGMSLSGEEDINTILEMILNEARELTCCDAGSLYLVNDDGDHLDFVVLQNDTMKTRMGGTSGIEINLPPVPLMVDGRPNHANVSSHVAITGEIIKIADVYESVEFDFTGPRKYDQSTGYRSKSMLVIPMRNHENDIIGVMQLLNAMDRETRGVIEFLDDQVSLVASLASQAAAALTKTRLIQDLKNLFNAFIKSIAGAIEEKSPYTGGHINRVVDLTLMMAEKINQINEGPFADTHFDDDDFEELKLAAWLHDVGKITTPEYVVDKSSKLETIFDRVHLVKARFDLIAAKTETAYMKRMLGAVRDGKKDGAVKTLEKEMKEALAEIGEDRDFVIGCNEPGEFMSDERIEKLRAIGAKVYTIDGETRPYLTENEMLNLSIRKGTLTEAERKIIENHATMTGKILGELPFPKKLTNVPEYAAGHHEKLDGTGYPLGLKMEDLSLAARIMAVADIFEALTAKDRPYKKPMKLSQAVRILGFMRKDKHIDPDIHDMFLNTGLFMEYAKRELLPWQIDEVEVEPSLTRRRVILATADPETESSLAEAFEGWGAEIDRASDPGEAMNRIKTGLKDGTPYRIMVLDMDLFKGAKLKEVRELPALKNFPAGAVIPLGSDGQCVLKLSGDTPRVLEKPVEKDALKARVREILDLGVSTAAHVSLDRAGRGKRENREVRRVLIADTSANTRMLFKYYLSEMPVEVDLAENGPEALSKFQSKAYDLLIVGMRLPGVSGYDTVKQIRALETANKLDPAPIIALTAHYIPNDKEKSLQAGCTDSLTKPVTRRELTKIVESFLAFGG